MGTVLKLKYRDLTLQTLRSFKVLCQMLLTVLGMRYFEMLGYNRK